MHSHRKRLCCGIGFILVFLSWPFLNFFFPAALHLSSLLSKDLDCGEKEYLHTNYDRRQKHRQIVKCYMKLKEEVAKSNCSGKKGF